MAEPLSTQLREATRELHAAAEAAAIFRAIIAGTVTRSEYANYLTLLAPVYEALESALTQNQDRREVAGLYQPQVFRSTALQRDLTELNVTVRIPESNPLALRIAEVARNESVRLAAYFYIRYFGDLSGGQMLSNLLQRALGLTAGHGLALYEFPELGAPGIAKIRLRAALDALPLGATEVAAVVDEARRGFQAHIELFAGMESATA